MQAAGVAGAAQQCLEALKSRGFNFFTGVADSTVASLIEELERDPAAGYVPAVREEQAVGLASGAYLSGRWPCVLMQNSGLGYSLNALTSLNLIYKIPLLLIVGWRGYQGKDAPEHRVMGAHCRQLLEEVGIPVEAPEADGLAEAVAKADAWMRLRRLPAAVLVKPGALG
jgi:sulfopyruvate decarboxylase alpha subunit